MTDTRAALLVGLGMLGFAGSVGISVWLINRLLDWLDGSTGTGELIKDDGDVLD